MRTAKRAGLQYHLDWVFCIGTSAGMESHLGFVKETVKRFVIETLELMSVRDKLVAKQRVRVVAFGDLGVDPEALRATFFVEVGPDVKDSKFDECLSTITTQGRLRGNPQSALEALSVAIRSDWTHEGDRQRHIIVMFTDASAHKLEDRVGEVPGAFRDQVPASLDELTDRWEGGQSVRIRPAARRLVIFGPDAYPWNVLGDSWVNTVWLPSQAGDGLEDVEFQTILSSWANGI